MKNNKEEASGAENNEGEASEAKNNEGEASRDEEEASRDKGSIKGQRTMKRKHQGEEQ